MNQNHFEIVKMEFSLVQEQINKYDHIGTSINTWMASLWIATSGWGISTGHKVAFLFAIVIVVMFWFFGGINKVFRQHYRKRREEIEEALQSLFKEEKVKEGFLSPNLPQYSLEGLGKSMFLTHVALPYLALILISLLSFLFL